MAEHSPGPWVAGVSNNRSPAVRDSNGALVAVVNVTNPGEAREANVRLIAAAPDLLEALRHLRGLLVTVREEQTSSKMGFGATESAKSQRAAFYAREIERAARQLDEALDAADAALLRAVGEAP